jgi:hypothetical protein
VLGFLATAFQHDARAWVYEASADRWDPLAPLAPTRARGSAAVAVLDDRIYLIGGLRNGASVPDFDVYDPMTGAWTPAAASASGRRPLGGRWDRRTDLRGWWARRRDQRPTPPRSTSTIQRLGSGRRAHRCRRPGGGMAGAVLGEALYVFGGEGNTGVASGVFDEVERLDPGLNLWTTLAPMAPGRHGTGAASLDGRIYVPGGASVQAFGAVDRVEVFIP